MNYSYLLSEPMKVKPKSNRASRQKSSNTPPNVLRLNYNESHYGMSPKTMEAFIESTKSSYKYPDWFAIDLKETIGEYYGVDKSCVVPTAGSSALIDMIGAVFINPGDEVLFGDPTFEAFRDMANDFGGVPVPVPLDEDMYFDLDAIYNAITPKTKIIVICNPNNPTGTFLPSAKVEEFVRKVPKNIIVVVDEAYIDYVDIEGTYSMAKLIKEGYEKPLIVLRTFSKIYGMAGVRVGYGIMHPDLADELAKSCHAWNVSVSGQYTAAAALKDQEYIKEIKKLTIESRNYVETELTNLGCTVIPSQTSFIYFKAPIEPKELTAKLAEYDINIGTFAYSRVSLGTMEMNKRFIDAMKEILSK